MSTFYAAKRISPYNLWIGSKKDSSDAQGAARHDIGLVVNCTRDLPFAIPGVRQVRVPIDDASHENDTFLDSLPRAVLAIHRCLGSGKGVLVHCYAGISRSASVVAAYLMWVEHLTARQAMARVRACKVETFGMYPNFEEGLTAWERFLR